MYVIYVYIEYYWYRIIYVIDTKSKSIETFESIKSSNRFFASMN